jgi:DNA-binding NarL/FixJ family response regulator
MEEIHAAGAHGYLSKSNASEDLLRVVRGLLESEAVTTSASAGSPHSLGVSSIQ